MQDPFDSSALPEVFDEDGNQINPIKEVIINPDELPF